MISFRITPDELEQAYRQTELKPARITFCANGHACGIGVLWFQMSNRISPPLKYLEAQTVFGQYILGFIIGFDDAVIIQTKLTPTAFLGIKDGMECAAHIFELDDLK